MQTITITKERVEQLLPKNVKESKELSDDAKKVLAVLINYIVTLEIAKNDGAVAINNETLCKSCEFGKTGKNYKRTLTAVQELIETNLIIKQRGKRWAKGEKHEASKYFINWDNLDKPIVKPTLEDLLKNVKKDSGTIYTTVFNSNIVNNTMYDNVYINDDCSTSNTSNSIEKNIYKDVDNIYNDCSTYDTSNSIKVIELNQYSTVEDKNNAEALYKAYPDKYRIEWTKVPEDDFDLLKSSSKEVKKSKQTESIDTTLKKLDERSKLEEEYRKYFQSLCTTMIEEQQTT